MQRSTSKSSTRPKTADYIETVESFATMCKELMGSPIIAVDTEFVGEHSYYPRLALIQIAAGENAWLIDPVAIEDLTALAPILDNPDSIIVMHDAEIDLQILNRSCGAVIPNLFDTQHAAAFAGLPESCGLAVLVKKVVGKRLAKGQQVTNWLKRPLSAKQQQYAAEDVLYLDAIYRFIISRLDRNGRRDIVAEEMKLRSKKWLKRLDVAERFRNLFLSSRISRDHHQALRELLKWRERTARKRDIPRRHVLSDDILLAIAGQPVQSIEELQSLRMISDRAVKRYGQQLVSLCSKLQDADPGEPVVMPTRDKKNMRKAKLRVPLIKLALEMLANDVGIAGGLIARVDELQEIARLATLQSERPDLPSLSGWRGRLVGEKLWAVARGELSLRAGQTPGEPSIVLEPVSKPKSD